MFNVNPGIMASVHSGGAISYKFIDILTRLGLTTSLNLCLDVGDINSYDGTSQTWFDVSGNGNDYFRGSTNAVQGTIDPGFVGTAGDLSSSTYFEYSAATMYFQEATAHTYADNWHKNNGAFSSISVNYFVSSAADRAIWSNGPGQGSQADAGVGYQIGGSTTYESVFIHSITNATREILNGITASATPTSWNFCGWSFDEATTTGLYRFNNSTETQTFAASTDTDAPVSPGRIGIGSNAVNDPSIAGDRIMMFAQWSRALTDAEMSSVRTELKNNRITSLP